MIIYHIYINIYIFIFQLSEINSLLFFFYFNQGHDVILQRKMSVFNRATSGRSFFLFCSLNPFYIVLYDFLYLKDYIIEYFILWFT